MQATKKTEKWHSRGKDVRKANKARKMVIQAGFKSELILLRQAERGHGKFERFSCRITSFIEWFNVNTK